MTMVEEVRGDWISCMDMEPHLLESDIRSADTVLDSANSNGIWIQPPEKKSWIRCIAVSDCK
jgi:hypothetical protein